MPIPKSLSYVFAGVVLAMTLLFFVVAGGGTLFLTQKQDEMASTNTRRMIEMKLDLLMADLGENASRHARERRALESIISRDFDAIFDGITATASSTAFDMFGVLYPDGQHVSWQRNGGTGIITDFFLEDERSMLQERDKPGTMDHPESFAMFHRGQLWIFSLSNVPSFANGQPLFDVPAATVIYGRRFWGPVLDVISETTLVDGLTLRTDLDGPIPNPSTWLYGPSGNPVAALTWEAPTPGREILSNWLGAAILLAVVVAVTMFGLGAYMIAMASRLRNALDRAESADRAKTQLLANVTHELRTPMNGVMGAAQLLADADLKQDDRELVDMIMTSGSMQLDLINDLLDLARLEVAAPRTDYRPLDTYRLMRQQAEQLGVLAKQKGLTAEVDIARDLPDVLQDARLLRQILVNLVGNAVKFTESGSVGLTVEWRRDGENPDRIDLLVAVRDTGIGIPQTEVDHIFNRFYQVDSASNRAFEGSGLGLSIVAGLLKALDGTISVDSVPGSGATFRVVLPCQLAESLEIEPPVSNAA